MRTIMPLETGEISFRHAAGRWSSRLAFAAVTIGLLAVAVPAAETLTGRVHTIDGDTIVVGGVHVRLQGIAAPEMDEPGGEAAQRYMEEIAEGRQAVCELTRERTHGRRVGVCRVEGQDVAAEVIAAGLARDCPRYSHGRYADLDRPEAARLPFPSYCVPSG